MDENKYPKVSTIEILLDSGASVSIIGQNTFSERQKIVK